MWLAALTGIYVLCNLQSLFVGPTHVLVVRGLDENADEEMLRYEFSKHAPIKVQNSELLLAYYVCVCGCVFVFFFFLAAGM